MTDILEKLDGIINEAISKDILNQYLGSALWASTDDEDEPLDTNYGIRDLDKDAINQAKKDLNKFWKMAGSLLDGEDETQVAHDFWLTRNGHGAGFWDRTYNNDVDGKKGDKLTKIAEKFGGSTLYVGDDGKIYSFDG